MQTQVHAVRTRLIKSISTHIRFTERLLTIINGPGGDLRNLAGGKSVGIGDERTLGLWHVHSVVPDRAVVRAFEGIELEVSMLRQHERRPGLGGCGIHGDVPLVLRDRVRDARIHTANHTQRRVGSIADGEGDGRVCHGADVPHPEGPIVCTAVEGVWAIVLLSVVRDVVNGVFAVANAVDISAWDGIVDGMSRVDGWRLLGCIAMHARQQLTVVRRVVVT